MNPVFLSSANNGKENLESEDVLSGIRIARISTVPFFVVSQLKHQIEAIVKAGTSVTVVTSNGPELNLLRDLYGVKCEIINIRRSISPWIDSLALLRLYLLFKREHIHIVHSTTPKAGLLTALAAFLAKVPVRLHTYTGQPWVNMYGIKRWIARTSEKIIGKLNTRCYADSESQRKFLIEQRIVDQERLNVIGEGSLAGVDLGRFDRSHFSADECEAIRKSLGIPESVPVLLFIGRITIDKGIRELIQAFEEIKNTGSDAHLILVGQFDEESGVSGVVSQNDIKRHNDVHIVGYSECPECYLAIADVLCLPSYREGFGTVVIEAAAMGVPTVGTNIYGLSDAVVHRETGILVEPQKVNELKAALLEIMADNEMRLRMGVAAKQRAIKLFDADKVNRQVIKEYRDLLHRKG